MNRNPDSPAVFKYPVSDVILHLNDSCNRLAAILQHAQLETWQLAITETSDAEENALESLCGY